MQSKIHPLTGDFQWQLQTTSPRRLSAAQRDNYNEQGYLLLDNLFDNATIKAVRDEIDVFEAERTRILLEEHDGKNFIDRADEITFTTHLVTRSKLLRQFCSNSVFQDLTHDLMGPDVRLYWDQAVYKKPGNPEPFPWHQDNGYTFVSPQQYLTCWIPLVDATEENGCPMVVPGVHKHGTLQHELSDLGMVCFDGEPDNIVSAPIAAGGAVVFSSLTPHATGPNLTQDTRKAYIVQFSCDGAVGKFQTEDGKVVDYPIDDADRQFLILKDGQSVN